MNCKSCGNPLSKDSRFCTSCGAKTEPDIIQEVKAEESLAENVIKNEMQTDAENKPEKQSDTSAEEEKEVVVFSSEDLPEEEPAPAIIHRQDKPAENQMADILDKPKVEEKPNNTPKRLTAGRAFGAVIISIFAVIFLVGFNFVISMRIGLSGDIVKNTANSMNAETLLDSKYDDDTSLSDYIYNNMNKEFIQRTGIKQKDMRSFLIKSDLLGFTSETLGNYASYLVNGSVKNDPSISSDDIAQFFKDNKKISDEEFGVSMEDEDFEDIRLGMKDDGIDDMLSVSHWSDELNFDLGNVHFAFSFITIGIIFAFVIVLFIWTAIVLDKNTKHVMGFFGNILLIGGIVLLVPSLIFVVAAAPAALHYESIAVYFGSRMLMPTALIALCTGAFEIILAVIFKLIKKHIKRKELKIAENNN